MAHIGRPGIGSGCTASPIPAVAMSYLRRRRTAALTRHRRDAHADATRDVLPVTHARGSCAILCRAGYHAVPCGSSQLAVVRCARGGRAGGKRPILLTGRECTEAERSQELAGA